MAFDALPRMMRDLDDDAVLPYTRPLDLALILDGHGPDAPDDAEDGLDGRECPQEGAGDGDDAEDDEDAAERENGLGRGVWEPWVIVLL